VIPGVLGKPNVKKMKHRINNFTFGCALLLISSCTQHSEKEVSANDIVLLSIERHGGLLNWKNIRSISYTKTILLFDSIGAEESKIQQYHRYELKPRFQGTIEWLAENDSIRISYKEGTGSRYVNGIEMTDSASKITANNTMIAATFVLFQPFKLLDKGTQLLYRGQDTLKNGRVVHVIQPIYGQPEDGQDRWWFYFDIQTNQLIANMVNHAGRYSLIENIAFDSTSSMVFNHHRKSYFVDSLQTVKYLRAEYFYEDFDLTMDQ